MHPSAPCAARINGAEFSSSQHQVQGSRAGRSRLGRRGAHCSQNVGQLPLTVLPQPVFGLRHGLPRREGA
eukprot:7834293-Lingulodinium_polyedra.AAC.1